MGPPPILDPASLLVLLLPLFGAINMEEGYTKYNCIWIKSAPIPPEDLVCINTWRQKLFELGLIGAYKGQIGFGNISIRVRNSSQFIITGTQTGHIPFLENHHYTLVTSF